MTVSLFLKVSDGRWCKILVLLFWCASCALSCQSAGPFLNTTILFVYSLHIEVHPAHARRCPGRVRVAHALGDPSSADATKDVACETSLGRMNGIQINAKAELPEGRSLGTSVGNRSVASEQYQMEAGSLRKSAEGSEVMQCLTSSLEDIQSLSPAGSLVLNCLANPLSSTASSTINRIASMDDGKGMAMNNFAVHRDSGSLKAVAFIDAVKPKSRATSQHDSFKDQNCMGLSIVACLPSVLQCLDEIREDQPAFDRNPSSSVYGTPLLERCEPNMLTPADECLGALSLPYIPVQQTYTRRGKRVCASRDARVAFTDSAVLLHYDSCDPPNTIKQAQVTSPPTLPEAGCDCQRLGRYSELLHSTSSHSMLTESQRRRLHRIQRTYKLDNENVASDRAML
jgi:hypothetical protein